MKSARNTNSPLKKQEEHFDKSTTMEYERTNRTSNRRKANKEEQQEDMKDTFTTLSKRKKREILT